MPAKKGLEFTQNELKNKQKFLNITRVSDYFCEFLFRSGVE